MEDAFSIKDLSVDNRDGGPGRGEERRGEERRGEERRGEERRGEERRDVQLSKTKDTGISLMESHYFVNELT